MSVFLPSILSDQCAIFIPHFPSWNSFLHDIGVSLLKIQSPEWAFEKEDNDQIGWYRMWSMQWIIISVHASPFLVSCPDYFPRARSVVWDCDCLFSWFRSAPSRHHCLRDTIYDSYRCRSERSSAMATKFLLFLIAQAERHMQTYS